MASRSLFANERGGFAPRRGRAAAYPAFNRTSVQVDTVKQPLGPLLTAIGPASLEPDNVVHSESTAITSCEYVASYSWTYSRTSTILVPGRPPLWTPLAHPQRLKEDRGTYFRDPNAARFPRFPTEPAVRALFDMNPSFASEKVDIFACGSTLGNLLRFVRSIEKPFRFNIELIGSTLFLIRKENDPRETIENVRGYGHTFPEAYTTWAADVKVSESHQRLCRYNLGHLTCVVRFECDGFLPQPNEPSDVQTPAQASLVGELLSGLEKVAVNPNESEPTDQLILQRGGAVVPQNTVFDLKTRSGRYGTNFRMDDIYPQLWIKQIPNFIIAYHDGAGLFPKENIHVKNVQDDLAAWEKRNKTAIQRLAILLDRIIEVAKQNRSSLLEVYCPSIDRLDIRKQHGDGVHALPSELLRKWRGYVALSDDESPEVEAGHTQDADELGYRSGESEPDYTACGEDCAYCGKCTY